MDSLSVLDVGAVVLDGGQTAGILKTGAGTLNLAGANTYSGNTTIQNGILRASHAAALGSTAGSTYVQVGACLKVGAVTVSGEHLYLSGDGYVPFLQSATGALWADQPNSMWAGPVTLQIASTICVATNCTLTIGGVIDGPGKLTKADAGTLMLSGSNPNTFTGGTVVNLGWIDLAKSANVAALPGPITVGTTNYPGADSRLHLLAAEQIPNSVPVTINASGAFLLNNFVETVGGLNLLGGWVSATNLGLLILNGDLDAQVAKLANGSLAPGISGHLSLGGSNRTFHIGDDESSTFLMNGDISDGGNNAGLIKTGPGELWAMWDSSYGGVTTINEGYITISSAQGLGSSAGGTTVAPGAMLWVTPGTQVNNEALTLAGTGTSKHYGALNMNSNSSWGGTIVLAADAVIGVHDSSAIAAINGPISGSGALHKSGPGKLTLGGSTPNNFTGGAFVDDGTLLLAKTNTLAIPGALVIGSATNPPNHDVVKLLLSNQIADTSPVTVNGSGVLTFDPFNAQLESIGTLNGSGEVDLVLTTLSLFDNSDSEFSGTITGLSLTALIKAGAGNFVLSGNNTYSGKTVVNNGHLYVNGTTANSSIVVNPVGRLHGQGTVGSITSYGNTFPGDNLAAPQHGLLKSSSIGMGSNSFLNIALAGTAASGKYDHLKVTGTVGITNAALFLTQTAMANTNDEFVIIENDGADPVWGKFAGLDEGAMIALNNSQVFKITYAGGDGNDVVLIQQRVPGAPHIGAITLINNGQIQITGAGMPGWVYTVEATEDLGNPNGWQIIGQATADANGAMTFIDPDAPNHPMRFYRFKAP